MILLSYCHVQPEGLFPKETQELLFFQTLVIYMNYHPLLM